MSVNKVLQRQWVGYSIAHQNRTNLYVHLIAVPLFMVGTVAALYGLVMRSPLVLIVATLGCMVSLFLQGRSHKRELIQPEPFTSASNFIYRIFAEQWMTFPRFVVTGGWFKNVSQAGAEKHESVRM